MPEPNPPFGGSLLGLCPAGRSSRILPRLQRGFLPHPMPMSMLWAMAEAMARATGRLT